MKYLQGATLWVVVLCAATLASGQEGLYGAPPTVDFSRMQAPAVSPASANPYAAPAMQAAYSTASVPRPLPSGGGDYYNRYAQGPAFVAPPPPGNAAPPGSASPSDGAAPAPGSPLPAAPQSPGVISQMLQEAPACSPPDESGCQGCGGGACGPGGDNRFRQAVCGPGCESSCCPLWYADVRGLIMGRDNANGFWTSSNAGNNADQLMKTNDIPMSWHGGWEITFGRWLCCDQWAVEVTYWGLQSVEGYDSASVAGGTVNTTFDNRWVEFGGVAAGILMDNAEEHRLSRRDEFHNLELNLVRSRLCCDGPFQADCSFGPRWFRFEEDLRFSSLENGGTWGADPAMEAYLHDKVLNNLVGFQVGANVNYSLGCNLKLFFVPKVGIYNNHIENHFDLYRGDGVAANLQAGSGLTGTYPVRSSADVCSMMSQMDLGLNWNFRPNWNAFLGYRVLFASGIGLADNQLPFYLADVPEIARIKTNGDLVLHGAFAGMSLSF